MNEGVVGPLRASKPIELGAIIANKYTILRPEAGVMSGLFVGRETGVESLRSVWVHDPLHTLDPQGELFLAELTKVAQLEHPQLRKVLDFGRDASGVLYAVYEPLELRNLADVVDQDWPLPDERVVWLIAQLLAALEVAHVAEIAHGDLRPENILVRASGSTSQAEEILVCGLGLAGAERYTFPDRASRPHVQLAEWVVGTPPYAAPEQLRGQPHDARSDVYGAGLLLFQLLTRTVPFFAANDMDTAWMQCFTPPPPPSGYGHVSPALEAICLKALAKTPDVRYQSANEMRGALLAAQAHRNSQSSSRRLSRTSMTPSAPPSARSSSPSIAAIVVADRRSEAGAALSHNETITMEAVETPIVATPSRRRKPSAALLLVFSTLATVASLILPDLKLRDTEETVVSAERGTAREFEAQPAELPPIELPSRKQVEPAAVQPPLNAPDLVTATARAALQPSAARPANLPVAEGRGVAPVARRVEPARVRVRAIEKNIVAAEASSGDSAAHRPVVLAVVSDRDGDTAEQPEKAVTDTAAEAEAAPVAAREEKAEPVAVTAAAAPIAEAPVAPAAAPAITEPRPVVLASTAPQRSAPTSRPSEFGVAIGEATSAHGAVSNAGLRGTFNQAALVRCYRGALQSGEISGRSLFVQLEFATNLTGRIMSAKLSGAGVTPSFSHCVEAAARLGRVREADTGEVRANVPLSFFSK
jgi:serine/threonine protein kinase